jgi:hypothetical protein
VSIAELECVQRNARTQQARPKVEIMRFSRTVNESNRFQVDVLKSMQAS